MALGQKSGGRKRGTPNKMTKTVREGFMTVFSNLQNHDTANLQSWAENNPTVFYTLASKLIPTEIQANVEQTVIKVIRE